MSTIGLSLPGFPAYVTNLDDTLPYENYGDYFGIKSDGSSDDTLRLKAAIEAISNNSKATGGILRLKPGATTVTADQTVLRPFVQLDLMGGVLQANLAGGNPAGVKPLSDSQLRNGKIDVRSTGTPGNQAGAHAAIHIGTLYGEHDVNNVLYTVTNLSPFDNISGVTLLDLTLITNKNVGTGPIAGGVGIQVMGNVWGCMIGRIRILASDKMSGGISLDWGTRGAVGNIPAIRSAESLMATNRTNFDNGQGFTTHPHDIEFFDILVGALTRPYQNVGDTGTFAFRVSGCHDIQARNILALATTEQAFAHTAGDLAYEFARNELGGAAGSITEHLQGDRRCALKGNRFHNFMVVDAKTGSVIKSDSEADNIFRAKQAPYNYVPIHGDSVWETDVVWSNVKGFTTAGANAVTGLYCANQNGGRFEDCVTQGFQVGARYSNARNVEDLRGRYSFSRAENVYIGEDSKKVSLIDLRECAYANRAGAADPAPLIRIRHSDGVAITGGSYGAEAADESGKHTILIEEGAYGVALRRPKINSHGASGFGIVAAFGEAWGLLGLFEGVEWGPWVTSKYAGLTIVPVQRRGSGLDGLERTIYAGASNANFNGLPMVAGDRIEYTTPAAGGRMGKVCIATGTYGTLSGTTGTISSGSKTLTVNTATGLRRGQRITIAGVTGIKTITAIVGTGVTIDTDANANVTNAAVGFSAAGTRDYGPIDS